MPLDLRIKAAREACRAERDVEERLAIFAVAVAPRADLVAWVRP